MLIIFVIQKVFTHYLEVFIYQLLNQMIDCRDRYFIKSFTFGPLPFLRELHHAVLPTALQPVLLVLYGKMHSQCVTLAALEHLQYAINGGGQFLLSFRLLLVLFCLRLNLTHDLV